jgi:hypothetical protein
MFSASPFTDLSPQGPDGIFASDEVDRLLVAVETFRRQADVPDRPQTVAGPMAQTHAVDCHLERPRETTRPRRFKYCSVPPMLVG